MSALLLGASVAITWLLDGEEKNPPADAARSRIVEDGAFAPYVWHLAVRNAPLVAERGKRISAQGATERPRSLRELPIFTDAEPDFEAAFELARGYHLAICDAVYLGLARRRNEALATLDAALLRAAMAEGLPLVAAR